MEMPLHSHWKNTPQASEDSNLKADATSFNLDTHTSSEDGKKCFTAAFTCCGICAHLYERSMNKVCLNFGTAAFIIDSKAF